jgi:chromosomal replication initiation ATPase DnaA
MIDYVEVTSRVLGVPRDQMLSKRRTENLVMARHICAYVMRENDCTFEEIGGAIKRHHSTAISGIEVAKGLVIASPAFAQKVEAVRDCVRAAEIQHARREQLVTIQMYA